MLDMQKIEDAGDEHDYLPSGLPGFDQTANTSERHEKPKMNSADRIRYLSRMHITASDSSLTLTNIYSGS
jgi:hypothetical protein